jgi:hypothetical protein
MRLIDRIKKRLDQYIERAITIPGKSSFFLLPAPRSVRTLGPLGVALFFILIFADKQLPAAIAIPGLLLSGLALIPAIYVMAMIIRADFREAAAEGRQKSARKRGNEFRP